MRARFYLKSVKPDDDEQPDNDLREIVFKKNQYGPQGDSVVVRYQNGMYLPVPGATSLDRVAHDAKADELFVQPAYKIDQRGENVSPKRTANMYAPTIFAREPEARAASIQEADFEAALVRLLNANKVHVADLRAAIAGRQQAVDGTRACRATTGMDHQEKYPRYAPFAHPSRMVRAWFAQGVHALPPI